MQLRRNITNYNCRDWSNVFEKVIDGKCVSCGADVESVRRKNKEDRDIANEIFKEMESKYPNSRFIRSTTEYRYACICENFDWSWLGKNARTINKKE